MQYLLVIGVALMLVTGQSLWKYGVMHVDLVSGDLMRKVLALAFSPAILLGCFVYVIATVLYIYTIGKYEYAVSYAMIVTFSLIFATIVASSVFHEKLSPINLLGMLVLLIGVALLLKR
jgi:drug/metabolite transporter (DMT)-like permease